MCGTLTALRLETRKGTKAELALEPRARAIDGARAISGAISEGEEGYDRGVEAIPEVALRWPIIARTWLRIG